MRRFSDPFWFQSFGSVLGFDWHSSGLTIVVCGALKEGLRQKPGELGLFFVGGKGKASRKTLMEIVAAGEKYGLLNDLVQLQQTNRTVAKVDSAVVQDGYQLYHHFLVFDRSGNWTVIQQGINDKLGYARRYHWLSEDIKNLTENPHKAVCGVQGKKVLNLVSGQNRSTRSASIEICQEKPDEIQKVYHAIIDQRTEKKNKTSQQLSLFDERLWDDNVSSEDFEEAYSFPAHPIITMPEIMIISLLHQRSVGAFKDKH